MILNTIQKTNKLNTVSAADEIGNGGAPYVYIITANQNDCNLFEIIRFQNGARNEEGSTHGILDTDLLEIVRHRLFCFQSGPYSSRENAIALTHIEEALLWLNKRVEDRVERNVLGKNEK